jgi:hypothetical protein
MRPKLLLTPECYRLWAIKPDLLLIHDIVMEKKDYDYAISQKDASSYDWLAAKALEHYYSEGFLIIEKYHHLLEERKSITNEAKSLVAKLPKKVKITLGIHAYREFARYLSARILFYRRDEPEFKMVAGELADTKDRFRELAAVVDFENYNPTFDFDRILERIIAKVIAGLRIARTKNLKLHDTDEYRPFAELVLARSAGEKTVTTWYFSTTEGDSRLRILNNLYRLYMPAQPVFCQDDLSTFLFAREDFQVLSEAVAKVDEILRIFQDSEQDANKYLQAELFRYRKIIEDEYKKLGLIYKGVWVALETLASWKIPLIGPLITFAKERTEQKIIEPIVEKRLPEYSWFLAFRRIKPRSCSIPRGPWRVAANKASKFWRSGHLPWYEQAEG